MERILPGLFKTFLIDFLFYNEERKFERNHCIDENTKKLCKYENNITYKRVNAYRICIVIENLHIIYIRVMILRPILVNYSLNKNNFA